MSDGPLRAQALALAQRVLPGRDHTEAIASLDYWRLRDLVLALQAVEEIFVRARADGIEP